MTDSAKPAVHANLCPANSHIHHAHLLMVLLHPMIRHGVLLAACLTLDAHFDFQLMY